MPTSLPDPRDSLLVCRQRRLAYAGTLLVGGILTWIGLDGTVLRHAIDNAPPLLSVPILLIGLLLSWAAIRRLITPPVLLVVTEEGVWRPYDDDDGKPCCFLIPWERIERIDYGYAVIMGVDNKARQVNSVAFILRLDDSYQIPPRVASFGFREDEPGTLHINADDPSPHGQALYTVLSRFLERYRAAGPPPLAKQPGSGSLA